MGGMNRLLASRKLWGALIGSKCIILAVVVTSEVNEVAVVTALGALWSIAIGGQAIKDSINKRNGEENNG
jgi:hypothetical protein